MLVSDFRVVFVVIDGQSDYCEVAVGAERGMSWCALVMFLLSEASAVSELLFYPIRKCIAIHICVLLFASIGPFE